MTFTVDAARRVESLMRREDHQFIRRQRLGYGLVSEAGRIYAVAYDDASDDRRELLTAESIAEYLAGGDADGYLDDVANQALRAAGL
jgi:hypothetical protein